MIFFLGNGMKNRTNKTNDNDDENPWYLTHFFLHQTDVRYNGETKQKN